MAASKPVLTPLPTSPSLQSKSGTPLSNPTEYRTVVGSLQYLLITRPDIAFAVNKLSQYMHSPTSEHWIFVKRLLRYLCGTINDGLQLHRNSPLQMHAFTNHQHHEPVSQLMAYSDADWGGDKDDFSSTSAYIVYLGNCIKQNLIFCHVICRMLDDLLVRCTISLTEALCGYQFALPRLDGRQLLTRSNPGQCRAINDEGMPHVISGHS
ncbi:hypothetical protein DKX38_020746 [Salix brachista]|uniref:Reverse transcriptase Ty1/copia-type domain-containing protein n=1 Tax=Salix brachista TaxID=2182728 RepID=A0A5N5K625_9ROSI|nr:hypothetical protein DKX38_020746 [Salix brachista]